MKINELKVGAILSYVTLFLSNIIGIIYTPIMIKFLGQSEYGLYSLVASTIGYLTILDLGLGNSIIRYTAKFRAEGNSEGEYRLNGMALVLYSIIGVVSIILGLVLISNVENIFKSGLSYEEIKRAKVMIGILVFNISISFPLSIFGSIIIAYEKFIFSKIINMARILINPLIMVPLLIMGYGSIAMVLVTSLLNIICLVINVWYCFCKLKIKIMFGKFDWLILKEVAVYSFFIFINLIVDRIYWSTDQFILGIISNTTIVAIYSVASQITMYYMNFSTAMSSVFLPKVTRMVSLDTSDNELSDLFIKIGRVQYILMGLIISGFILFGKQFIAIWAGELYIESYNIALVIMIPLTVPLIQTIGISILQAKNMHGFRSIVYFIIAVINIFLSIRLGKIMNGFGCGLATCISMTIGHILLMNIYYYKKVNLNIVQFWIEIFKLTIPIIISISIGIMTNKLINEIGVISLIVKILIYSCSYFIFMWNMGMNKYEQGIFGYPLSKINTNIIKKLKTIRG